MGNMSPVGLKELGFIKIISSRDRYNKPCGPQPICRSQKNVTLVHVLRAAHPLKEADHNAPCCPLLLPIGQPITHLEAVKQSAMVSLPRDQRGRSFSQMAVR